MGLAPNVLKTDAAGGSKIKMVEITFDSTYPAGGEPLTAADLGFTRIDSVEGVASVRGGAHSSDQVRWDKVNNKLQAFTVAGTELTGDQSALVATVRCAGV